jgi:hypothetical protein
VVETDLSYLKEEESLSFHTTYFGEEKSRGTPL